MASNPGVPEEEMPVAREDPREALFRDLVEQGEDEHDAYMFALDVGQVGFSKEMLSDHGIKLALSEVIMLLIKHELY